MTNEMNGDIIIVNTDPKVCGPQTIEKKSGQLPAKAKMTGLTFKTLKRNIISGKIHKASQIFNGTVKKARGEIYIEAAQESIEDEKRKVINSFFPNGQFSTDQEVSSISVPKSTKTLDMSIADVILSECGALLTNSSGSFMHGNKFVAVQSSNPKPIIVSNFLVETFKNIRSNHSVYIMPKKTVTLSVIEERPKNSWRSLFDTVSTSHENSVSESGTIIVTGDIVDTESTNRNLQLQQESNGLNEDFEKRNIIARIGDELAEIRRLKSKFGESDTFNNGLIDREKKMLHMLSEILGVTLKTFDDSKKHEQKTTSFQQLIDNIVGYTEPLTKDEYQRKLADLTSYYNNPDVQQTIYDLRLKNILFDINDSDASRKISEAERLDNDRRAARSDAIDLLDSSEESEKESVQVKVNTLIKEAALEQAQILHKRNKEMADIRKGAAEQAQILHKRNKEMADIRKGAAEQAQILHKRNKEMADIRKGAAEQAQILFSQRKNPTYIIIDNNDRYGSIVSQSKPIRISDQQLKNIRDRRSKTADNMHDMLVSLKDQLDQLGLGEDKDETLDSHTLMKAT